MRVKTGVYGYFVGLMLFGVLLGFVLRGKLGVTITAPALPICEGAERSLRQTVYCYVALMRFPLLIFCAGFTVFATFAGSAAVLYVGLALGSGWQDAQILHGTEAMLAAALGALLMTAFLYLCGQAAAHRLTLRSTVPDARFLMHSRTSRGYLMCFLAIAAIFFFCAAMLTWFAW